ncbi:MAG TPA: tetratricopeptide repeat protein [Bacteroidales bacterium]|nr:tetratricopeptide repeat protein [Bacteroidales bacterium]HOX77676.1 tetratricopeptide repeat protein [Bacteroidales bacterium]HPI86207.1 tetratricopeptide repeat protein [Bacteroidales bacterium]
MKSKDQQQPPRRQKNRVPGNSLFSGRDRWRITGALLVILLISLLSYLPVFHNELLTYDDQAYIQNNPMVYSMDLKEIFTQNVKSNYHPVTVLVLALEYRMFGLDPTGYHVFNLFLHLINTLLVFYALYLLTRKAGIALVASLLFGVHPLHVESVAWVAELKDLLYTLFFLSSYIFYLKYLDDKSKKSYALALGLFLVSLLSKAMAASLPLVLILTDYFKGRKIDRKSLIEKIPFFLFALVFGIVAIIAQKSTGAAGIVDLNIFQRIVFACYGFISYLFKLVVPLNLSAYYSYPIGSGGTIPLLYYIFPVLVAGLVVLVYFSLRFTKKVIFAAGFFLFTVFFVLQLLPVGGAVMADRYAYIPSIGIFYLAGEGFYYLWNRKQKLVPVILLSAFTIFFAITTYSRSSVWKTDLSLWTDVIEHDPSVKLAYINRGNAFKNERKYDRAVADFSKAMEIDPEYALAYFNRGSAYEDAKKADLALADYNKALELDPELAQAFNNRGNLFAGQNKTELALADFEQAIRLDPGYSQAYNNRGTLYANANQPDLALADFTKAIELNPNNSKAYNNRANIAVNRKKYDQAIEDFSRAIKLNPTFCQPYYNRGSVLSYLKKYDQAIADFTQAIAIDANFMQAYFARGQAEYYSGKKAAACRDFRSAANLGFKPAADALLQLCN